MKVTASACSARGLASCSAVLLALLVHGVVPRVASADGPRPGANPVVLESRARVEVLHWVGEGKTLVFGGRLQAGEPDWSAEARFLDQDKTVRLPGLGESHSLAASPDGGTVVGVERVGGVTSAEFRFVDVRKREQKKALTVDVKERLFTAQAVAFSRDGTTLACAGYSATPTIEQGSDNIQSRLLLLDLKTGKVLADLARKDDVINAVAFSPDGKFLVTGHNVIDKEKPGVRVWDVEKAALVKEWPAKRQSVTGVAVSPDGKHVASVGYSSKLPKDGDDFKGWEWDNHVTVHDIKTGELVTTFKGHTRSPVCVAFSPDGLLASGGADKAVKIWKVGSEESLHTFTGHTAQLRALAFAPDGKRLASGGLEKGVYIWDMSSVKKAAK